MMQPYYQDLVNDDYLYSSTSDKIISVIAAGYVGKAEQSRVRNCLNKWQKTGEEILNRPLINLFDFFDPRFIVEIPQFIKTQSRAKAFLRKFYEMALSSSNLSPAFDPLAAKIMLYFKPITKPQNTCPKHKVTGNIQLDYYLDRLELNDCKFSTIKNATYVLMNLLKWVAEDKNGSPDNYKLISCKDINKQDIDRYAIYLLNQINEGICLPVTIERKWTTIKKYFIYARKMKWSILSISGPIIDYSYSSKKRKIYPDDKLTHLLNLFAQDKSNTMQDFVILSIVIDKGPRIGEVLALKLEDVHLVGSHYLLSLNSKGRKRTIKLSGPASLHLDNYFKSIDCLNWGDYIFGNERGEKPSYDRLYQKFCKLLGDDKDAGAYHRFRNTYITKAIANNAKLRDVQINTGHKNLHVTSDYVNPEEGFLRNEAKKFPNFDIEVNNNDE